MAWFIECVARPLEPVDIRLRYYLEDEWVVARMRGVNLTCHEDVGGLLLWADIEGPAEVGADAVLSDWNEHESVHWMLAHLDSVGRVRHIEGKVLELVGRTTEEILGQQITEFIDAGSASDIVPMWLAMMRKPGSTRSVRRCFVRPDGTELWAECTYLNRFDNDGHGDMLMLGYDITEKRAQEQRLLQSNEEISRLAEESRMLAEDFRMLADEVPSAVFRCDPDGRVTFHNARWDGIVQGTTEAKNLHNVVHHADRSVLRRLLAEVVGAANAEGALGRTASGARRAPSCRSGAGPWPTSGHPPSHRRLRRRRDGDRPAAARGPARPPHRAAQPHRARGADERGRRATIPAARR